MLQKIKNKLCYEFEKRINNMNLKKAKKCYPLQNVSSIDETLDKLLSSNCSMCRYGDGEFKVMLGKSNGFQKKDPKLAKRLKEVITSNDDGVLLCIPNVTSDTSLRTHEAVSFWNFFLKRYGAGVAKLLSSKTHYYNAHVTRLYMDYQPCGKSEEWFGRLKKLWSGKEILIVEGEKTRLGVGNDLFDGVLNIKRILCPSKSAFSFYEDILNSVVENWHGELVLIALGQTATVLAYDLHKKGIRALDIGHVDIEYEWFLQGAKEKIAVEGKFVKEVDGQIDGEEDIDYLKQIILKVGI